TLLEDVMNFSKSELGQAPEPSEIVLSEFVIEVVEEVARWSKYSHHICVSTNNLGVLVTDGKLLKNIIVNLLTNAVRFSPGKDEISLNVIDEASAVTIEVSDEGIGIRPEESMKIFEPFVRGSASERIE